jgi:glycosyltransferase involved in cell wall biosynthesis
MTSGGARSSLAASDTLRCDPLPRAIRAGIVCDIAEENWPSMDWAAEALLRCFADQRYAVATVRIQPAIRRRLTRFPGLAASRRAQTTDRIWNRYRDYPPYLRRQAPKCDLFHIVDHSYAHLALELPRGRCVVTCHDLDAFRVLLRDAVPAGGSRVMKRLARKTLLGLQLAARVICVSDATRDELLRYRLIEAEHLVVVPNAIAPDFSPNVDRGADEQVNSMLGTAQRSEFLLHVGSAIPRKRIDILLRVFAAARQRTPALQLVRIGGPLTSTQQRIAGELGVADSMVSVPNLSRDLLAALYRKAGLVLLTSESEGFGLTLAEALACGTPAIATDIPVLREVGGDVARFCTLGNITSWAGEIESVLQMRRSPDAMADFRERAAAHVVRFSLHNHAAAVRAVYDSVLAGEAQ